MSEPLRIGLRLLGFLLLFAGFAIIVGMIYPGPRDVADVVNNGCASHAELPEECDVKDFLSLLELVPVLLITGFVLVFLMRPSASVGFEKI